MQTNPQTVLFGETRLTAEHALEMTAQTLRGYGARYRHWAMAFSGGKDSSAMVTAVVHLIETGRVPAPASLTCLYADTRMELPPLHITAMRMMSALQARGVKTQVVLPAIDDRFFVYMFGWGVPPPSNTFRWCTSQIKIEPMEAALQVLRAEIGEKILMLTGVRVGESAARDARIFASCGKNGSECGQGWLQVTTRDAVADTLAPILHWRLCLVWDWLMAEKTDTLPGVPAHGFPTAEIARTYGLGEDGSEDEMNARTGCVGCNLASRDNALEGVIRRAEWAYLSPLLRLRPLYAELKKPHNRLRKQDELRADGTPVSNQGRMGPLTMEARRMGLAEVIAIQTEINANAPVGRAPFSLINAEEAARIEELMAANTWPQRWTGEEVRADALLPVDFVRGGGRQLTMHPQMTQEAAWTL